jgi:deoxyribose-phosphate aldolase
MLNTYCQQNKTPISFKDQMMEKNIFLSKRIEALFIGPNITDNLLISNIEDCINNIDFFSSIAPNLHQIELAAIQLKGIDIDICGEIAYPLGNLPLEVKRVQIKEAVRSGAQIVDVMMPIEYLISGEYEKVENETAQLCSTAANLGVKLTQIANFSMLDQQQKMKAVEISLKNGGHIRTASGFGVDTDLSDIKLIRDTFGEDIVVTSCGNIFLAETALAMRQAGADYICTQKPFKLIKGLSSLQKHGYQEV